MRDTATQTTNLYSLYRRGVELLEDGSFGEATVPLAEVAAATRRRPRFARRSAAPTSATASTRRRRRSSRRSSTASPVNDYAHFCLGRALSLTGERERARHHLALASNLRPDRGDYRLYRDRLRAAS